MESIELKVTAANFANLALDDQVGNNDKSSFGKQKIDWDDYFAYQEAIPEIIKKGKVYATLKDIGFNLLKAFYCIKDGGRGDSDGFGVEPDTWIVAYLNSKKEFVSPFALEDFGINRNISNLLVAGINPVNEDGTIKICPFDNVEKDFRIPRYFKILLANDWGFADSKLNVLIPPSYDYVLGDQNRMVWIRQHNNLCGLLNLENEVVIPALYDRLNYIDEGKHVGCYKATLNGKTGILSQKNEIIKDFE